MKEALVVTDGHYYVTPDNKVYVESVYDYSYYERYLQSFDNIRVAIRAKKIDRPASRFKRVDGKGVSFYYVTDYKGLYGLIRNYKNIREEIKRACVECECGVFRIPSALGIPFANEFLKHHKPFAIEVVADPWENFKPSSNGYSPIISAVRIIWTMEQKMLCKRACCVAYVTERYLQKRYPPGKKVFTTHYSSVDLPDDLFSNPKSWCPGQKKYIISHVANDISDYGKGHITLIHATKILIARGYNIEVHFIGDGVKVEEFKRYSLDEGVYNFVHFLGRLPNGLAVREEIRSSDLFVFPSASEGLPRVLLEAMSEGLPCISSNVGGISELLPDKYLFEFTDYTGIARCIEEFINSPSLMREESIRNLNKARQYSQSVLNSRRKKFYDALLNRTNKGT